VFSLSTCSAKEALGVRWHRTTQAGCYRLYVLRVIQPTVSKHWYLHILHYNRLSGPSLKGPLYPKSVISKLGYRRLTKLRIFTVQLRWPPDSLHNRLASSRQWPSVHERQEIASDMNDTATWNRYCRSGSCKLAPGSLATITIDLTGWPQTWKNLEYSGNCLNLENSWNSKGILCNFREKLNK